MANSYLPETLRGTAAANSLQIATLIGSLSRSLALLSVDIEHEEERGGVHDLSDPAYPVLARSLRARRENIGAEARLPLCAGSDEIHHRTEVTRCANKRHRSRMAAQSAEIVN
jgi:hypothetical protein